MKRTFRTACGAFCVTALMLISMPVLAAGDIKTYNNPSDSITIPVSAGIENYYEISVPAIGGTAGINLTNAHNDKMKSNDDNPKKTFYGICDISAKGFIEEGKKLQATMNCGDLVKAGDAATKEQLKVRSVDDDTGAKIEKLFKGESGGDGANFGAYEVTSEDSKVDFTTLNNAEDTEETHYRVLRTTLNKAGQYAGNVTISFAVVEDR